MHSFSDEDRKDKVKERIARLYILANLRKNASPTRIIAFTVLQLLQRNVQLGAPINFSILSSHWFVAGVRERFTIIDLITNIIYYRRFLTIVSINAHNRKRVLFVNDRGYSHFVIAKLAKSVGEAYIAGRWIGGTLTNFKRIKVAYNRLLKSGKMLRSSERKVIAKRSLKGTAVLNSLPGSVFFNSSRSSFWGTREASALRIPAGGVTDTDYSSCDTLYTLPGNDDSFGSVYFLSELVAKIVLISKMNLLVNFGLKKKKIKILKTNFFRRSQKSFSQIAAEAKITVKRRNRYPRIPRAFFLMKKFIRKKRFKQKQAQKPKKRWYRRGKKNANKK